MFRPSRKTGLIISLLAMLLMFMAALMKGAEKPHPAKSDTTATASTTKPEKRDTIALGIVRDIKQSNIQEKQFWMLKFQQSLNADQFEMQARINQLDGQMMLLNAIKDDTLHMDSKAFKAK